MPRIHPGALEYVDDAAANLRQAYDALAMAHSSDAKGTPLEITQGMKAAREALRLCNDLLHANHRTTR